MSQPIKAADAFAGVEDRGDGSQAFLDHVLDGLSQPQKVISSKYLYDQRGSELFDAICDLPEYYPTRTELALFDSYGPEIARLTGADATVVEFGSGASIKIRRVLQALVSPKAYVPTDISREFLLEAAESVARDYPDLPVTPVVADFTQPFTLPAGLDTPPVLGLFPGSTIGNFTPDEAFDFLETARKDLGNGAGFVIGVDLIKSEEVLHRAYNDAQGVTAEFNLNLLTRMNRELGSNFNVERFSHRAIFNDEENRIEMHLISREAQTVRVRGHSFDFKPGESIRTEVSYKYGLEDFQGLAADAGWDVAASWTDERRLFSLHYLRAP